MPKQIWKIEQFHGGINSNSDPRDLSPSESPSLQDISVDSIGRMKTMGKWDSGNLQYAQSAGYSDNFSTDHMILTIASANYGSGINNTDDTYNNMILTFDAGSLSGNSYRIIDYDYGSSQTTIKFRNYDGSNLSNLESSIDNDAFSIYSDGNITSTLTTNRGLFTFGHDRKLNGTEADEFFTLLYAGDKSIDIKDSTGWSASYITFPLDINPTYYIADGYVRICDLGFGSNTSKWLGYIPHTYFKDLRANNSFGSSDLGWTVEGKDALTPTKGKCSIGRIDLEYNNDTTYRHSGEISGFPRDKIDEDALNLQVGVQYTEVLGLHADASAMGTGENAGADSCKVITGFTPDMPKGLGSYSVIVLGSTEPISTDKKTKMGWDGESFILTETTALIVPILFPDLGSHKGGFDNLEGDIQIKFTNKTVGQSDITDSTQTNQHTQAQWKFPVSDLIAEGWNFLVCTQTNVSNIYTHDLNGNFEWGKGTTSVCIMAESGSQYSPSFITSAPMLSELALDGFQPGDYSFYYTDLYDVEKQESLPFKFKDVQSTSYTGTPNNVDDEAGGIQNFKDDTADSEIKTSQIGENYLAGSLVFSGVDTGLGSANFNPQVGIITNSGTITDNDNNSQTDSVRVNENADQKYATDKIYYIPKLDINRLNIVGAPLLLEFNVYYCGSRKLQDCTFQISDDSVKTQYDIDGTPTWKAWGHGLKTGEAIQFSNIDANNIGIVNNTTYYVSATKDTTDPVSRFKLSTLPSGGDVITLSNNSEDAKYSSIPNKRIVGSRMYYKAEGNDHFFLIGELDYVKKGFRWLPEGDTLAYDFVDHTLGAAEEELGPVIKNTSKITDIKPVSANLIDTYRSINGFSGNTKSVSAQYKTAVVNGRRAYVGNVKQDGKTYPDRIIKSRVNRFDIFPSESGILDVAIRDGESIVKLEAYADRILQFKENSLYIINVSENVDFLEDTYRNKGCAFDYHVTKTDMGIAWFNKHGAYLYDGQKIHELLEREALRLLSEDYMIDFTTNAGADTSMTNTIIGYVPKKKNLIIRNGSNDVLIYDFVTGSWTKGKARLAVQNNMTNFALSQDQDIFYIDGLNTNRKTWNPSSSSSSNFLYLSADVDFGQPAQRKKIYNVQISYKGNGASIVPKYGVNGTSPASSFATGSLTDGGTSAWTHITLKPTSAINNIYSFQLKLSGTAGADFEINDISIVYRLKDVK